MTLSIFEGRVLSERCLSAWDFPSCSVDLTQLDCKIFGWMNYSQEVYEVLQYFEQLQVALDCLGRVGRVLACPEKAEN